MTEEVIPRRKCQRLAGDQSFQAGFEKESFSVGRSGLDSLSDHHECFVAFLRQADAKTVVE